MQFRLVIDSENAAFDEDAPAEVARIMRDLAETLETAPYHRKYDLRDINGNTVGFAEITL